MESIPSTYYKGEYFVLACLEMEEYKSASKLKLGAYIFSSPFGISCWLDNCSGNLINFTIISIKC